LAAMASLDARALAILPLCHLGALNISGYWNITPCLGGLPPVLRALKRAFSAPSTCIVLAGIVASSSRLPARLMSLAASRGPTSSVTLGATSLATLPM